MCAIELPSAAGAPPVPAPTPDPLVRPFHLAIPDADVEDLQRRLANTRWPDRETVPDWSQGVRLDNARALVDHWRTGYDWRRREARLARFPQFLTTIDGLDIHVVHVRSPHPDAMPLILTHGWPGSFVDFLALVEPLTDPVRFGGDAADAFDVVIPSMPGFGFSEKPSRSGWTVSHTARAWAELMRRLGYTRWTAHGGDWGAAVTTALGALRPEGLLGIHLSTQYVFPSPLPDELSPDEQRAAQSLEEYLGELGGSNHLQATKPETVGIALADSPAGQAAWIYEKYQSKTDNDGLAEDAIDVDVMLDGISLAWFTNTAASSARVYWENYSGALTGPTLTLPVAVTVFPRDIPRPPRSWIDASYRDLVHVGEAERGGHFAALEVPDLLVRELRAGLRPLRRPLP